MRTATACFAGPESQDPPSAAIPEPDRHEHGIPLNECVRTALASYLRCMGDHQIENLYRFVLDEVERPLIESVLNHTGGNQTAAARILGLSRGTLRKKVSQFGLISANDPDNS